MRCQHATQLLAVCGVLFAVAMEFFYVMILELRGCACVVGASVSVEGVAGELEFIPYFSEIGM